MTNLKTIKSGSLKGTKIKIEGLWVEITGLSWMFCHCNPVCLTYVIRVVEENLPVDDKVYYCKIGGLDLLVHKSEL